MGVGFNARILTRLLRNRPHTLGAEVGVFKGDTSRRLLEALPDIRTLICVDQWVHDEDFVRGMPTKNGRVALANWKKVEAVFRACVLAPYAGRVWVLKERSVMAARMVEDGILDWVFIDGNHTYKHTKADIYAWWPKLRVGGILTGDDYQNKLGYGVIKAVDEIFGTAFSNSGKIWYINKEKGELT
jgi:predicted O-methyltransferase YrrM